MDYIIRYSDIENQEVKQILDNYDKESDIIYVRKYEIHKSNIDISNCISNNIWGISDEKHFPDKMIIKLYYIKIFNKELCNIKICITIDDKKDVILLSENLENIIILCEELEKNKIQKQYNDLLERHNLILRCLSQ